MNVSVIIPVLNEQQRVAGAIVRAWEAGANEVIVVDGGSRDNTPALAQKENCQWLTCAPGRARQQNLGASAATGEVLLFLHADTHLAAGGIDQIRAALAQNDVLAGAFRQRIEAAGFLYRSLEWGNAARVHWRGPAYGDQGLFVRRWVFAEVGGFPNVEFLEDLLLTRALRRRTRLALLPGPLFTSARRWQKNGVVRQTLRNWSLLAAHLCGVPPERLARWYRRHDAA